ncbi:MAG: bifunctional phosphoribosyl-AMP cyclohydrolase/phosphoribosyl-ATP diphosphatase HisIE [Lachnospiraceae bacterium]|nr:bifunctional phosphoribosyl-AMP cyclohydrolase/phosphoribosyl-ATP diphosphatase HisIE [Lachnospiraceae bacterium]
MDAKKIIPCIYLSGGKAVANLHSKKVLPADPAELALDFENYGADEILVFDLSTDDASHELNLSVIRQIKRAVDLPLIGAGNVKRLEDIKKLLYAGCRRAALNFSKKGNIELTEEVSRRFGKDKIACVVRSAHELLDNFQRVKTHISTVLLLDHKALPEVSKALADNKNISLLAVYKTMSLHEAASDLRTYDLAGIAGGAFNNNYREIMSFKRQCRSLGLPVNTFESSMSWEELKEGENGLIPCIVQDYRTREVLMMAWMNREAFEQTIATGLMTYYSRSRQSLWVKGETSGHFQYVRALYADCDNDTILAKVSQVGAACHTGERSCFFKEMLKKEYDDIDPLKVFEEEYNVILDRKNHPKEGSYTNYLFDKGIDKILKKIGEENTEVIIAAKNPDPEELKYEIADWLYHAMVLMVEKGVTWEEITGEIATR